MLVQFASIGTLSTSDMSTEGHGHGRALVLALDSRCHSAIQLPFGFAPWERGPVLQQ